MVEVQGRRRIAEGREAEVFEWGDGLVLRLLRDPMRGAGMERSVTAMNAARAAGVAVPRVFEIVTIDGRPGLVLERVDGPDMFAWLAERPWRLVRAGGMLADLHVALHETRAPDELVDLRTYLRGRIARAETLPPELAEFALGVLDTLPDGDGICHGDFHPGNVLLSEAGPVVIDWTNATRGDPVADFARTRMMFRLGDVPPGLPWVIRTLTPVGRGIFASLYARAYVRRRPVAPSVVARWEIVRAADRCDEGIEPELPALLSLLEGARRAVG